jgi:hypothetical protein
MEIGYGMISADRSQGHQNLKNTIMKKTMLKLNNSLSKLKLD